MTIRGGRNFKLNLMKYKIFIFLMALFFSSTAFSDNTLVIIDRRGFVHKPTKACSILAINKETIFTSCSSLGFETNTREELKATRSEYIFFISFPEINNFKTLLSKNCYLSTTYFDNDRIIAITPYSKVIKENILSLANLDVEELNSHISKLESELSILKNSYIEADSNLQKKIQEINKNPEISEKLNLKAETKSQLLRKNFTEEEIKYLKNKYDLARKDQNQLASSQIKARLSILLKNTIENDLKQKN
jgi:hypothetical protein